MTLGWKELLGSHDAANVHRTTEAAWMVAQYRPSLWGESCTTPCVVNLVQTVQCHQRIYAKHVICGPECFCGIHFHIEPTDFYSSAINVMVSTWVNYTSNGNSITVAMNVSFRSHKSCNCYLGLTDWDCWHIFQSTLLKMVQQFWGSILSMFVENLICDIFTDVTYKVFQQYWQN